MSDWLPPIATRRGRSRKKFRSRGQAAECYAASALALVSRSRSFELHQEPPEPRIVPQEVVIPIVPIGLMDVCWRMNETSVTLVSSVVGCLSVARLQPSAAWLMPSTGWNGYNAAGASAKPSRRL
jgi:hypothetical protein